MIQWLSADGHRANLSDCYQDTMKPDSVSVLEGIGTACFRRDQLCRLSPANRPIDVQHRLRAESGLCSTLHSKWMIQNLGDSSMATATTNQSKSSFVKEFFSEHPEGNVKAVNDAWQRAGNEGTIGDTVIYKIKAEMRPTGKLRQKDTGTATKKTAATRMPAAGPTSPGKGSFVKEFLNDNPQGNVQAANKAWLKAGMTGTISSALVDKIRASMGLTGNRRAKSAPAPTTTGRATAAVNQQHASLPQDRNSERTSALLHVETEIDRLIFTVMGIGNLPEVETVLRDARRKVYAALSN
jgi:hypothetical protein